MTKKRTRNRVRTAGGRNTKQKTSSEVAKRVAKIGLQAIEGQHLAWRFGLQDRGGDFPWVAITETDQVDVIRRMAEFEKMTVQQMKQGGSHHIVPFEKFATPIFQRLRALELDDFDALCSFRVTGTKRFWCIKLENIYSVLWWDPEHKVYPVSK